MSTTEILTNLSNFVSSVPQSDLRTVVSESGAAFNDAGPSIGQIIDTSTSFIDTANANFDVTTALIRDSRVVLQTQVDKGSAIRSFARDLSLFSGTVADNDKLPPLPDRQRVGHGQRAATFLQQNRVNLGQLINNLVTTNEVIVKYLQGIRQVLVIYPYVVAGGFTVAKKNDEGRYDAQFGFILNDEPQVCEAGYVNRRAAAGPVRQADGDQRGLQGRQQEPPRRGEGAGGERRRGEPATGRDVRCKDRQGDLVRPGRQRQHCLRRRCRPALRCGLLEIDVAPAVAGRRPGVELV